MTCVSGSLCRYLQKPAATEVRNAVQGGGATGPVDGSADSTANSSIDSLGAVGEKTRRPKPRARTVGIEDLKLAQLQKVELDMQMPSFCLKCLYVLSFD